MCGGHRTPTWTLMLLSLAGVLCNTWKVEYQQQHICAVKGSSVAVLCSFRRPDNQRVEKVMWGHGSAHHSKGRFIVDSNSRKVSEGFQYIGDKRDNCSLKIHRVEHDYAGMYAVKIIYNKKASLPGKQPCPRLKVVDLSISMAKPTFKEAVMEGDSVNVTCVNSCDGGNISSVFTWFKDGEPINEGPVLYLTDISSTNSGNYTCSLKAHKGTTSRVVQIDVEGGPKNTSVFIRRSVEGDDSSNLILTCRSYANPPVENYTWFKTIGDDVLDVGHQPVLFSSDGGCYFCCATNKHGSQNSSAVTLNIKQYWATLPTAILAIAAVAVAVLLLIATTVTVVRRYNRKRMRTPKADCEEDIKNTDYVNWLRCDPSQDTDHSEGVTTEITYATVYFHNNRKSNMEQQNDSQKEEVIYSTVCREQHLNSSYIEPS